MKKVFLLLFVSAFSISIGACNSKKDNKEAVVIVNNILCDLYNEKVIAASKGSIFLIDCVYDDIANYDKPIIVSVLDDDTVPLSEAKPLKDFVLVIGNESHGVSEEIIAKASQKVKIEMKTNKNNFSSDNMQPKIYDYFNKNIEPMILDD